MKKSIRFRLTGIFIAIILLIIAAVFLVNRYFLMGYYQNQKIDEMERAYEAVSKAVLTAKKDGMFFYDAFNDENFSDREPGQNIFRDFSDKSNLDIVLLDPETGIYTGASREDSWLSMKLKTYIEFNDIMADQIPRSMYEVLEEKENHRIQRTFDRRTNTMFLESWGKLRDDSTYYIMSIPLESIAESTRIMNRFLLIVGLCALVIGSVLIYFTAGAITKPVNQLAGISQKMSNLDFSEKYEGGEQDEIGILGSSINTLSDRLHTTIDDLTEANRKLQEDINLKEKTDNMRKDFISDVSHELKTPIAIIEGYAEGLCEGMADDKEQRDYYCSVIMDESQKMNRMVKSLTSLIHYEFGDYELNLEQFDISELVRNVLSKYAPSLEAKGAELRTELPESCLVIADEFKMEEVFSNYLSNALNHLDGEKNILVKLIRNDCKTVKLSVYNDGDRIPDESIPRIWEKFYKVDKARTREYGGSGIGLSIVKAIMEAHKGGYGCENCEKGVNFYITLDSPEQI